MFYFSKFSFLIFLFSLFAGFYFSSYATSNIQVCGVRQTNTVFDYTNNDYLSSDNCNSLRMLYAVGDTNTKATITNSSTGVINMAGLATANSVGIYGGANSNIINQGKITNVTSSANNSNVSGMYLVGVGSTALNDTTGEIVCNTGTTTFGILGSGGTITNNGNIENCGRGMYVRDIGATAVNSGTITCLNGTGIGMYAMNGATATNKGAIKDCATGMVSNGIGSNAINDSSIACYNTTGKGMQSLNGGTITNNGSIVGCAGSVNSGNIDNGSINDGTIGSPTKPILTGLYVCGIDTGLLSYTNKEGNTLECSGKNVIEAKNSNVSAINNGVINVNGDYGYAMSALNGATIVNNNDINIFGSHYNTYGLYANGINSKATNSKTGKILCINNNIGVQILNGANAENNGLIENCSYGINIYNNYNSYSNAVNGESGKIKCADVYKNNSIGMFVDGFARATNNGLIENCAIGMQTGNIYNISNNILVINSTSGVISCTWVGNKVSAMNAMNGGVANNNGLIQNCSLGIYSYDNSSAINGKLGKIMCDGSYSVGMESNNSSIATNEGLIQNCFTGMQSNYNSNAINGESGAIICNKDTATGMDSAGNTENYGLIQNCGIGMKVYANTSANSSIANGTSGKIRVLA